MFARVGPLVTGRCRSRRSGSGSLNKHRGLFAAVSMLPISLFTSTVQLSTTILDSTYFTRLLTLAVVTYNYILLAYSLSLQPTEDRGRNEP